MYIATRRIGLKGSSNHNAGVAANRKMSFPLLTTTNVCGERDGEGEKAHAQVSYYSRYTCTSDWPYQLVRIKRIDIFERCGGQFRRKFALHSTRYGDSLFECGVWLWAFIILIVIVSDLWVNNRRISDPAKQTPTATLRGKL